MGNDEEILIGVVEKIEHSERRAFIGTKGVYPQSIVQVDYQVFDPVHD